MSDGLILWGRKTSANVQKVMFALEELGLDYEQREVGGKFGGLDSPDYGAMNPNRLVPSFQDGNLTLWESHAIVRYLAATHGQGTLWPEFARERALADQWTDWTATTLQPAWISVFFAVVRTAPSKRDPQKVGATVDAANKAFAIMDAQLAKTPFLAGDHLTYADIVASAGLYRWTTMDIERAGTPHVDAWHERLKQRPAFRTAIEVPYDDLVVKD